MPPLDLPLRSLEQVHIALSRAGGRFAKGLHLFRRFGAKAGADHVIVERHVLPHGAGVALAAAAAHKLAVDAGRIVQLGANYLETAYFGYARAKLNVGAAARHVRGDSDLSR